MGQKMVAVAESVCAESEEFLCMSHDWFIDYLPTFLLAATEGTARHHVHEGDITRHTLFDAVVL